MENLGRKIFVLLVLIFIVFVFLFVIGDMPNGFIFGIPFMLFFVPFMCAFFWMTYTCTRFAAKIKDLHRNPCQATADQLLDLMQNWGNFTHILLRSNMIKFGVKSAMIRDAYNRGVYPNRQIALHTKQRLYFHFLRLNIWDLRQPAGSDGKHEEGGGEKHGEGGEENVWHTLKDLPDLGQFDVFFDVNIAGSQIDNVVLSQNGGVFLIEVKSWGGYYPTPPRTDEEKRKMVKIVSYDPGNPDMVKVSQQIIHHRSSFNNQFSSLQLSPQQIRDVLVISYPHNDTVRVVDRNSFTGNYSVLAVHELADWLPKQTAPALTPTQRQQLVNVLSLNSRKRRTYRATPAYTVAEPAPVQVQPAPASVPTPVSAPAPVPVQAQPAPVHNFCPYCGQKLTANSKFCMSCGQKV